MSAPATCEVITENKVNQMASKLNQNVGRLLGTSVFAGVFLIFLIFIGAVAFSIHKSLEKSAIHDISNLLNSVNDSFEVFNSAVKADA